LVKQALQANPNLASAEAALRQARELTAAQRGAFFPQASLTPTVTRALTPTAAVSATSPTGNPYYSLITPQLNVSFVPDVFGANARAVESLAAQEEAQAFQLEAVRLTLTANVVTGAIQAAMLSAQIAATEDAIGAQRSLLEILRRQQSAGQTSGADVAAQEAALAQSEQALPPLRKQLAVQRDALLALAGRFPSEAIEADFALDGFALPTELPVSLPSDLVTQRPDIRQAEANLHAASAGIGQAVAARLPQITLSAQAGGSANSIAQLFHPGTAFWVLTGGLTAPLFDGFALFHREQAARAAFDQAGAQYRATVLAAFQNVADSLKALSADADGLRAAKAATEAAKRSLDIVRAQLNVGQVPYANLLIAQNAYQQAHIALVQAQANRLADTAALFQALGGGWWNRADVTESDRRPR
jgi:NodT family efflux transporter outer membrane factor (OMF) lipoprotein